MSEVVDVVETPVEQVDIAVVVGPRGPAGEPGPEGPQGPAGEAGASGATGPAGAAGERGPEGDPGADGPSAFELAVDGGFTGTLTEWLASLVGPEGPQGPEGDPGPQGDDGVPGADGAPGSDGEPGAGVPTGGTTGQVLAKATGDDYDTEWVTPTGSAGLDADGQPAGYVPTADGDDGWEWAAPTGGSPTRTTSRLDSDTVELAPSARIIALTTTAAARVRLYRTEAQRAADAPRPFTIRPQGDAVLADWFVTTAGTLWANPVVDVARDLETDYYLTIDGTGVDVDLVWEGLA